MFSTTYQLPAHPCRDTLLVCRSLWFFAPSSALREEFIRDAEPNIDNGWAMWREWFGDNEKTLFNTACF